MERMSAGKNVELVVDRSQRKFAVPVSKKLKGVEGWLWETLALFTHRMNAEKQQHQLDARLAASIDVPSFSCEPPLTSADVAANGCPPLLDGYHDLCEDERDT